MSSLAGALGESPQYHAHARRNDVAMGGQVSNASLSEDAGDSDEEMGDLFGNDNDVEEFNAGRSASPTGSAPESERLASPEREHRRALEYGEEYGAEPDVAAETEVKEAEVTFPNLPVPRSSDGDTWVIRTPNYVKIEPKAFNPDVYEGPEQEEEGGSNAKERSMTIKLKQPDQRQSNARIIRWSDGSLSLRLGKELFDVSKTLDTSAVTSRQLGASQPASQSKATQTPGKGQGLTYLVAQHKRSQVLQAEAVITGFMSLRPTGMQSETHRMLVRAVGQKHNKIARLKLVDEPTMDPEREKAELIKQSSRKPRKREFDDGLGGGRKRRYSRRTADHDVWSDDDEEGGVFAGSDDDDGGSRRSSPKKGKRKSEDDEGHGGYQEDDFLVADSDGEGGYNKKRKKGDEDDEDPLDRLDAKIEAQNRQRGNDSKVEEDSDDNKDAMDVESEEEDEEEVPVRRTTGTRRRAAVSFDDDEE